VIDYREPKNNCRRGNTKQSTTTTDNKAKAGEEQAFISVSKAFKDIQPTRRRQWQHYSSGWPSSVEDVDKEE